MSVDRSYIRAKSMVRLVDAARRRELVSRYPVDPASGPARFHRLLGGSIELGERAVDAAVREIAEELRFDVTDLQFLGVVENIFTFEGEHGHEVVFIYRAAVPTGIVPDEGAWFAEDDGAPMYVQWRALDEAAPPLYPDGLAAITDGAPTLER